ncbi:peptide chain release factor N(5)-glutamine methyltransferase [Metamycoplasma hominis]|uniref:peptide chain release factor N(5)-glutamine methyltransferase n=1 Tax=Metamycoplasma hominis TaxID=2098 RepID=UPI00193A1095|nr:peptide chain release factor N(5)-glutamine methyltransferase [Metamycoplasma hominis]
MIDKEILLREKERYNLPLYISKKELRMLKKDVPVQKIIGYQEFQNVILNLKYKTLIPRYETEEVILAAYPFIKKESKVLDLGCGSGLIGLAIKKNKDANVTLSDISRFAIKQTKINAKLNNLNVNVIRSNWFNKITSKFDVIVCNPPYLKKQKKLIKSLKWEPKRALFARDNGLFAYKKILKSAFNYLNEKGIIIFEVDPYVSLWFKNQFPNVLILKDINNKDRIALLAKNDLKN